jgi:hypothetical protein
MPDLALHELATEGTGGAAGCDSTSTVCLSSDRFCPGSPGSQTLMDAPSHRLQSRYKSNCDRKSSIVTLCAWRMCARAPGWFRDAALELVTIRMWLPRWWSME